MYILRRSPHNPLIAPSGDRPWEARGTFNPSPIQKGNMTHLLYRALGRPDALMTPAGISTVGIAMSFNGEQYQGRRQFIVPEHNWEEYGCEDPRAVYFEGTHVIFYTALGGVPFGAGNIKVAVALSKNLDTIEEKHLVTPFNAKAMTLFPERINGKITAILSAHTDEPPAKIAIAQVDRLEELWNTGFWEQWHAKLSDHVLNPLRSSDDHVEVGAAPIKTKEGWLFIYSYIQHYFGGGERVFGVEALLLDLKDPLKIIGRTNGPILVPEEIYERYGITPNIVFPTGALLQKNGRLDIYYGAADTVCAKASANLDDIIAECLPKKRRELVVRSKDNPIITPEASHPWEKKATFNAAALDLGGKVHLLYRAMSDDNTSVFGYASSKDGTHITERLPTPCYIPREDFEAKKVSGGNSGCEDPRLTLIGGTLYVAYTAFNGEHVPRAAISSITTKDFLAHNFDKWSKPQLTTPDIVDDKNTCILPEKIAGQYMLIHRIGGQICADFLDSLDFSKSRVNRCIEIMGPRPGMWDSVKIGIAGPPIKTKLGWLLIYHGISRTLTYRLGAVLLDLENPSIVISRTGGPIFEPTESYEMEGQVHRVVFSCGAIVRKDVLYIYYGGADSVLGVATCKLSRLLTILVPSNLKELIYDKRPSAPETRRVRPRWNARTK